MPTEPSPSQQEPAEYNPYAAPGAPSARATDTPEDPHRRRRPGPSTAWAMAYYVTAGTSTLIAFAQVTFDLYDAAIRALAMLVGFAAPLVGVGWLSKAWAQLPVKRQRIAGVPVTPDSVALRMLVPAYNLYWMFVVPRAMSAELGARLERKGRSLPPVAGIAMAAGSIHIFASAVSRITQEAPGIYVVVHAVSYAFWATLVREVERRLALLRSLR